MKSHLEEIGGWVAGLRHDDIPADVRRAAQLQILNMVAAAHASTRTGESASVPSALAAMAAGGGRATVLATGQRLAPVEAAIANAAASMAQDFDDIIWMGHTCHSAVFAPLAVAEHERRPASGLVIAVVAPTRSAGASARRRPSARAGSSCARPSRRSARPVQSGLTMRGSPWTETTVPSALAALWAAAPGPAQLAAR